MEKENLQNIKKDLESVHDKITKMQKKYGDFNFHHVTKRLFNEVVSFNRTMAEFNHSIALTICDIEDEIRKMENGR